MSQKSQNQFGLKSEYLDLMSSVFSRFPEIDSVKIYGSRAIGTHRENSDIDLAVVGTKVHLQLLNKIANLLDDILMPWKIDLSILHHIQHIELLDHIKRNGKLLYNKEQAVAT